MSLNKKGLKCPLPTYKFNFLVEIQLFEFNFKLVELQFFLPYKNPTSNQKKSFFFLQFQLKKLNSKKIEKIF